MASYSICGLYCDICEYKEKNGCKGCRANEGKIFWGECDLYKCCDSKGEELFHNSKHCGLCADFPCAMLKEWASSEGTERIENLRKLIK